MLSKNDLLQLVAKKIKGQGNQIDCGSQLATILNEIIGKSYKTVENIGDKTSFTLNLKSGYNYKINSVKFLTIKMPDEYDESEEFIIDFFANISSPSVILPTGIKKNYGWAVYPNNYQRIVIKNGVAINTRLQV